jgi:hypothetical protein
MRISQGKSSSYSHFFCSSAPSKKKTLADNPAPVLPGGHRVVSRLRIPSRREVNTMLDMRPVSKDLALESIWRGQTIAATCPKARLALGLKTTIVLMLSCPENALMAKR